MSEFTSLTPLDRTYLRSALAALDPIPTLTVLDETVSTNDLAKTRPLSDPYGIILADKQSQGKGRRGRSFYSPEGSGLYLSIYFRQSPGKPSLLPFYVAVAAARTLISEGFPVGIKWINDLIYQDKKLGGILCESRISPDSTLWIAGIGINILAPSGGFPDDIQNRAIALNETRSHLREDLAVGITKRLFGLLPNENILRHYKALCVSLGKEVMVHPLEGPPYPALAEDLAADGSLKVRLDSGEIRYLDNDEISIRPL